MTNSTFPVVHGLEHPLVVGLLYEDHVTAYTVRGVVSESLLHGHAGVNLSDQTLTQTPLQVWRRCCLLYETSTSSSYCLERCLTLWDPVVKWECSSH